VHKHEGIQPGFQDYYFINMSTDLIYGSTDLSLDLRRFFSFLILYAVSRTPWTGDQPIARPLLIYRRTQIQNKRTQTLMP
jgi:hypothetical protein